ncbi:hypothetical protein MNBD_GAMMA12-153 [hydrothermal vent metagenome]|uniref:STAS domain-containing protein n=1 Tax=hydrothermal vent metagenome TaxID=652676 RepID=A0A3B0YJK1_9ZZZZ
MGVALKKDGTDSVIISVSGRFDFSFHKEFREAYKETESAQHVVVDMSATEYIDSSALGMLLLLREHTGSGGDGIEISGCNDSIKKVLILSKFDKMFTIK